MARERRHAVGNHRTPDFRCVLARKLRRGRATRPHASNLSCQCTVVAPNDRIGSKISGSTSAAVILIFNQQPIDSRHVIDTECSSLLRNGLFMGQASNGLA
jgi:hypothetical protein